MALLRVTLDTNCMVAVDEGRDDAEFVLHLLNLHEQGRVDCAMAVSSASEMQKDRSFLNSVSAFNQRRERLGFLHLELLPVIMRYDIGFWDNGLWSWPAGLAREREIFQTMFPNTPYDWEGYALRKKLDPHDRSSFNMRRWRNKILDAQAFWAHENAKRDVFVTADREFKRLIAKKLCQTNNVMTPQEAVVSLPK